MFYSQQRTLKHRVSCVGVGLHTGVQTVITLCPAAEDTGIVFNRTDVGNKHPLVPARYDLVTHTMLGTRIQNAHGVSVDTIEHLMAALWGCQIDNAVIEIDGPEVPIMDGSSEPFVFLIECAGIHKQTQPRRVIEIKKEIHIIEDGKFASVSPSDTFAIELEIDFKNPVIGHQKYFFDARQYSFKTDVSSARTFGFLHEVEQLRSMGLAKGGSLDNAIVINEEGIMNKDGLRFDNEFARHKLLDCVGDFFLAGGFVKGSFKTYRSGHDLNNKLLRALFSDETAWSQVSFSEDSAAHSAFSHTMAETGLN
ncbi:MAG: UDP-3-O-acyl-N-acetylglucosamine deacetylase [Alphaproteobacteria bacterium]|nr:UDP-3-O-acyl-N-acetylglucosamine deacetylase [Alphaproteobacteria bacterium]